MYQCIQSVVGPLKVFYISPLSERRLFIHVFPQLSIARCSFVQLSERGHCVENENERNDSNGDSNPGSLD